MADDGAPLLFIEEELQSYLPTGWKLPAGTGSWDARQRSWSVTVRDGAWMDWSLTLSQRDVTRRGRLEALRRAIAVLVRQRLG